MIRTSCKECPSSFELIPPADTDYSVPREKPKTEDYIQIIYECAEEQHRNTIYWERKNPLRSPRKHNQLMIGSNLCFDLIH